MTDSPEPESNDTPPEKRSFFAELKRRKVFRIAASYVVVAWIIVRGTETALGVFGVAVGLIKFVTKKAIQFSPVEVIVTYAFVLAADKLNRAQEER